MQLSRKAAPLLGVAALTALGLAAARPAQADLTPTLTGVTALSEVGYGHGIPDGTTVYTYNYSVSLGGGEQITGHDPAPNYIISGNYVELTNVAGVLSVGNGTNNVTFSFLTGTGTTNTAVGRNTAGTDIVAEYFPDNAVSGPVASLFTFNFVSLDGNQGTNNISFTGKADNSSGVLTPNFGTVGGPVTPAPEPSSVAVFALAGVGLLGLTLRARKCRVAA